MADQLYEITRSLGRIEARLDSHGQTLEELKASIKPLQQLASDFQAHVKADQLMAIEVTALINRPAKRRKAVVKWIGGVATIVIATLLLVFLGIKP